jgi:hypothetical protein
VAWSRSETEAHLDVTQAIDRLNALSLQHAEDYRRVPLERLDALLAAVWATATRGELGAQRAALRILERQTTQHMPSRSAPVSR